MSLVTVVEVGPPMMIWNQDAPSSPGIFLVNHLLPISHVSAPRKLLDDHSALFNLFHI